MGPVVLFAEDNAGGTATERFEPERSRSRIDIEYFAAGKSMSNMIEQHHLRPIDDRTGRQAGIGEQRSSTKLSGNNSHAWSFDSKWSSDDFDSIGGKLMPRSDRLQTRSTTWNALVQREETEPLKNPMPWHRFQLDPIVRYLATIFDQQPDPSILSFRPNRPST